MVSVKFLALLPGAPLFAMLPDTPIVLEDPQTTRRGDEMPAVMPEGVKANISPPEQLSLASFIKFPLPSHATAGSDLAQYFVALLPDTTTMAAITDALQTLPLPPPSIIRQLSSRAASAWASGSCSLVYAHANDPRRFSFWTLSFWRAVCEMRTTQMGWRTAQHFLSQCAFGDEGCWYHSQSCQCSFP